MFFFVGTRVVFIHLMIGTPLCAKTLNDHCENTFGWRRCLIGDTSFLSELVGDRIFVNWCGNFVNGVDKLLW